MKRRNILLIGILLALSAAAVWGDLWWRSGATQLGRVGQPLMANLDPVQVQEIRIRRAAQQTTLRLGEEGWVVAEQQGYPANIQRLNELLVLLVTNTVAHQVSTRAEKLTDLGLLREEERGTEQPQDALGAQISLWDAEGESLGSLILGKARLAGNGTSFGGQYVRYPEEETSYLVGKELHQVAPDPKQWIDAQPLSALLSNEIASLEIRRRGSRTQIRRESVENPWALAKNPRRAVNANRVADLLRELRTLRITEIAAATGDAKTYGRTRTQSVRIERFGGGGYEISIGEKKTAQGLHYLILTAFGAEAKPSAAPPQDDPQADAKASPNAEKAPQAVESAVPLSMDQAARFNRIHKERLLAIRDWNAEILLRPPAEYLQRGK